MDRLPYENPALFGSDSKEAIVAVEVVADDRVRVFVREESRVATEDDRFTPFLLLESPDLLGGGAAAARVLELAGPWEYRFAAFFPGWKALQGALRHLRETTGRTPGAADAPFYFLSDPVQQYLTATGRTLYKGLRFEDLRRLQLDIETTVAEGFEFPNPLRDEDRITLVSLSDSTGWEESVRGDRLSEPDMLVELARRIRERDPDVVEGHNLFNFDLSYLEARAARHGQRLKWGRDGSPARSRPSRFSAAERTIQYQRYEVHGRQLLDTLFLVQLYDVGTRELESFGLKAVARHLGVAQDDRTYVDPSEIPRLFRTDMERLVAYGLGDVRETREVSRVLGQSYFHQTRMFPLSHQSTVVRGNATKIDALFLREYLRQRRSVPRPPPPEPFAGGYTDCLVEGVVAPVVNCDVQSLYPSVMLTFGVRPAKDDQEVFPSLLTELTRLRLEAKAARQRAREPAERALYEALQGTFKVLINSFYGYLGFSQGHFADFAAAARVAAEGRTLIQSILQELEERGARPVEVDTDGVYFVPPEGSRGPEAEEALVAQVSDTLPPGIRLELGGRYRAMLSYKAKNYVLLGYDGELSIRGSGLRSRGIEKFQRAFLEEMFRAVLEGRPEAVPGLKERYLDDLRRHRWTPEWFAKTETLHDSLDVYRQKRRKSTRNASAAYELALATGRPFQPGDQVTYYVAGDGKNVRVFESARLASQWDPEAPDENVAYYAKKLEDLYRKFEPFVRPGSGQLALGLAPPAAQDDSP
ncbi:MAG: DNA polymerase domain-containing protein [Deferrisomatales bacterium]|nr:DNA polymerase domain-containing protein [Deferrisomatales bacterium]